MARVIMQAVVSVDGFIARPDDSVGPLFDWYSNGDTELLARPSNWRFQVSQASVVPVVLGEGKRFFGRHAGTVLFDDPDQVVQGDRVLHLHYTVRAPQPAG